MISLFLGFLVIINGYTKKTIVLAIIVTGIFATADLIYSYFVLGSLRVRRIIEHFLLGETLTTMNHGFFGELVGYALIITLLSLMTKNLKKSVGYTLIIVFSLGVLISTSRSTALSVILTIAIILLTQKALEINFKKLFVSALAGLMILFVVALSYSYILKSMNISSEFSEQIYWRLVEEPLSIFKGDVQEFGLDDNKVQGSMRWRYYKYLRDVNVFFSQNANIVLFGFGAGGYKNIGEINLNNRFNRQYASHNFYTNLISEYGIIGIILFLSFFFWLLLHTLKKTKQGLLQFSLIYILISKFIITFSDDPNLTDKISFIFYGAVIAELILLSRLSTYKNKIVETSHIQLAQHFQRT
jgi:O-antigen ligase